MGAIPIALTIAGSDSGGGAGIQADLKTFSALEVFGASVVTALTSQNTKEVRGVHSVPVDFVRLQIRTVFDDLRVDAVKVGMLSDPDVTRAVADELAAYGAKNVVVDPVMISKSGAKLLNDDAVTALKENLIPLARVITPNLHEAEVLLGLSREQIERDTRAACELLLALGPGAVVLKGGHFCGPESQDLFFDGSRFTVFSGRRVATKNTHGTGCTFSSAVTALLAAGRSMEQALSGAKHYVQRAIECADELEVGTGHGPVHHFHSFWAPRR